MKTLIALTALVLIVAVNAQYVPIKTECCEKYYQNSIPAHTVKSSVLAFARCRLNAYVFTTPNGKYCVNPKYKWVQEIHAKLKTQRGNRPRRP
ncbi:C-C motif chemokine 5-like [Engraulis encrasicolus]|uniref:C-C motif chemokine 5-like n=1 Tax=Engraulis encrasicolus TaxID=184585 RepID=UPI002FD40836